MATTTEVIAEALAEYRAATGKEALFLHMGIVENLALNSELVGTITGATLRRTGEFRGLRVIVSRDMHGVWVE